MKFSSIEKILFLFPFFVFWIVFLFVFCFVLCVRFETEKSKQNIEKEQIEEIHSTQQTQRVTKVKCKNRMQESSIGVFIFIHYIVPFRDRERFLKFLFLIGGQRMSDSFIRVWVVGFFFINGIRDWCGAWTFQYVIVMNNVKNKGKSRIYL